MLDRLPLEIILRIAHYVDNDIDKKHPDYAFRHHSQFIRPLSQVNHYLQQVIAPLLYNYVSLVRKYEYDGPQSASYDTAARRVHIMRHFQQYINELEMPSSMGVSELLNQFQNVKSIMILGDNNIRFDMTLNLEHMALVLPKHRFQIHGLKRLDLLIDPRLIENMNALDSFHGCPIQELNITVRDLSTIIRYIPFLNLLSSLKSTITKFSIRCSTQPQPSSLKISQSDILTSTNKFFQIINSFSLTHLSFDFLLIRMHSFSAHVPELNESIRSQKSLVVDIIEPSLAGPLTAQQHESILSFLLQLSSYEINSLNLVFGIQTEIPYNTALHVLQNLLFEIHHGDDELINHLKSITKVGALMAWHIIDDSVYMDYGITKGLLSYESDGNFTPGYRMLEVYDVLITSTSLSLIRNHQSKAHEFWSRECQSSALLKFSRYKRSSLWD